MQKIKSIDIFVHPDYYQMAVPYLPFHERQLAIRRKWEERIGLLKDREDTILLYFSYMTAGELNQGLKDLPSISNKIEREEIERIKRCMGKLGDRFILFGWLVIPTPDLLEEMFKSRNLTYIPGETKIRGYGEIFEVCTKAWVYKTAESLGIPSSNVEYIREESLTNADCNEINNWRVGNIISPSVAG